MTTAEVIVNYLPTCSEFPGGGGGGGADRLTGICINAISTSVLQACDAMIPSFYFYYQHRKEYKILLTGELTVA